MASRTATSLGSSILRILVSSQVSMRTIARFKGLCFSIPWHPRQTDVISILNVNMEEVTQEMVWFKARGAAKQGECAVETKIESLSVEARWVLILLSLSWPSAATCPPNAWLASLMQCAGMTACSMTFLGSSFCLQGLPERRRLSCTSSKFCCIAGTASHRLPPLARNHHRRDACSMQDTQVQAARKKEL